MRGRGATENTDKGNDMEEKTEAVDGGLVLPLKLTLDLSFRSTISNINGK